MSDVRKDNLQSQKIFPRKQSGHRPYGKTAAVKKERGENQGFQKPAIRGDEQQSTIQSMQQQNERRQYSKKEGNPVEKNFIAKEGDEEKTQEPQL